MAKTTDGSWSQSFVTAERETRRLARALAQRQQAEEASWLVERLSQWTGLALTLADVNEDGRTITIDGLDFSADRDNQGNNTIWLTDRLGARRGGVMILTRQEFEANVADFLLWSEEYTNNRGRAAY